MKTRIIISLALLSFLLGGCSYYKHIEDESEFGKSPKGSFIRIWVKLDKNTSDLNELRGELIAVDSAQLYLIPVETEIDGICKAISKVNIESFSLYYAKPNTSFWTIPLFTAISASHGIFAFFTAPINLMSTSFTQAYIARKSRSQESDINFDELAAFARFPYGLPSGIRIEDIH
tara:strand:- start:16183 stop:16707 length:525 start_codon:yes stop_codon:yes gene_type:complete